MKFVSFLLGSLSLVALNQSCEAGKTRESYVPEGLSSACAPARALATDSESIQIGTPNFINQLNTATLDSIMPFFDPDGLIRLVSASKECAENHEIWNFAASSAISEGYIDEVQDVQPDIQKLVKGFYNASSDKAALVPRAVLANHYWRVHANVSRDLEEIAFFVAETKKLVKTFPFLAEEWLVHKYPSFDLSYYLRDNANRYGVHSLDELVAQENPSATDIKLTGFQCGSAGYEENHKKFRELNDWLVDQGNERAVERKINYLLHGKYGYPKDPSGGVRLNEILVAKRNPPALKRKREGLLEGKDGYGRDVPTAKLFIDELADEKIPEFIEQKIYGHTLGTCGYELEPEKAIVFIEQLVAGNNPVGIRKKAWGLAYGTFGYPLNPKEANDFIERLVAENNPDAINLKIEGLKEGRYGYERNLGAAEKLRKKRKEQLTQENSSDKETQEAIQRLSSGEDEYGLDDLETVRVLNDRLAEKENLEAILNKIKGFSSGFYGYKKEPANSKVYIESLTTHTNKEVRKAGKYIQAFAMKYKIEALGFGNSSEKAAIEYIKNNRIPY